MIRHLIENAPTNYHNVTDMDELSYMVSCLVNEEVIAVYEFCNLHGLWKKAI